MTESAEGALCAPDLEPTRTDTGRGITARWNLGALDEDGFQRYVELSVEHWSDVKAYRAVLRPGRCATVTGENGVTYIRELICLSRAMRPVVVYDQPAARLNRQALEREYSTALRVVRELVASGDVTTASYFDVTSSAHSG